MSYTFPACRCDGMVDVADSKSADGDIVWVRVPPPAPRRSKLCIACSDFFQKSERTHSAAPPFQPRPACAGLASDDESCSDLNCLTAPEKDLCFILKHRSQRVDKDKTAMVSRPRGQNVSEFACYEIKSQFISHIALSVTPCGVPPLP